MREIQSKLVRVSFQFDRFIRFLFNQDILEAEFDVGYGAKMGEYVSKGY